MIEKIGLVSGDYMSKYFIDVSFAQDKKFWLFWLKLMQLILLLKLVYYLSTNLLLSSKSYILPDFSPARSSYPSYLNLIAVVVSSNLKSYWRGFKLSSSNSGFSSGC